MTDVDKAGAGAYANPFDEDPPSEEEPRILDVRLAEVLGIQEPGEIRRLIGRHKAPLSQLGEIVFQELPGDRLALGAYLNTRQAAFICAKVDIPFATEVTLNMVRTFIP